MASEKKRLDVLLVERGLAETRAKAQALILAGTVFSGEKKLDKAGYCLRRGHAARGQSEAIILGCRAAASSSPMRSTHFAIDATGFVALDVGASTGGFTDVLLQSGAAKVYAVDVGHGQLAWKLRQDPRVVVLERINARYLTADQVPEPPDIVVCDASFIGLETVLPAALGLAKPQAQLVALIKPQFEVGPEQVGKGGVVRDPALHQEVCERIAAWLTGRGWEVAGIVESPIRGPEGQYRVPGLCPAPLTAGRRRNSVLPRKPRDGAP